MGVRRRFASFLWSALVAVALLSLALPAGAASKTRTRTFSSGDLDAPISFGETSSTITVERRPRKIVDVNVKVRLTYPFDSDLAIGLASPHVPQRDLSSNNGADGSGYGSGPNDCEGTFTVFDDEADQPITKGTAPFAGRYKPEEPLTALDGTRMRGEWRLTVFDGFLLDNGTLGCWQLRIRYRVPRG